jgi:predicted regulator of Ras-like GTPase activity (Roadblock/LC7/MglB family)
MLACALVRRLAGASAMPIVGNLKEMPLPSLIETNCRALQSAKLHLSHREKEGEVYFSDGQVVHATTGDQVGEPALWQLMRWAEGTFVLENDVAAPERSINRPWADLLLDAMLHQADWNADKTVEVSMPADEVQKLKAIEGVTGVITAGRDGVVMAASVPEGNGDAEAAVTVFLGALADQISQSIPVGPFEQGIVSQPNQRMVVISQGDRYVGLLLDPQASPAIVLTAARAALS